MIPSTFRHRQIALIRGSKSRTAITNSPRERLATEEPSREARMSVWGDESERCNAFRSIGSAQLKPITNVRQRIGLPDFARTRVHIRTRSAAAAKDTRVSCGYRQNELPQHVPFPLNAVLISVFSPRTRLTFVGRRGFHRLYRFSARICDIPAIAPVSSGLIYRLVRRVAIAVRESSGPVKMENVGFQFLSLRQTYFKPCPRMVLREGRIGNAASSRCGLCDDGMIICKEPPAFAIET